MKTNYFLILMAGLLFIGCGKKPKAQPQAAQTATNSSGNPLNAPAEYLGAAVRARQTALKTVGTVNLQQTIRTFQGQEGRSPRDLNELVSAKYLSVLPTPPMDMKFDYNPANGEVKVVPK
jgi:hypothetical protein